MAESDRLRDLQVGESGHDGRGVLFGEVEKRATERNDALRDIVECAAHVQAEDR